ncbi:MAG: GntR family transcriptional regulator [Chloroflexi bacterium]|nr:GntR family transcriptional regulator [Chloroflexota bacterium]
MSDASLRNPDGSPLRATTLREGAFLALRRAVLSGQLAPGARLLETELAERLGMSRNPVREALARLEAHGLVRAIPNQSARVIRPQPAQVQDALLVRAQLELLAVRLVMRKAGSDRFAGLAAIVAQMQALADDPTPPDAAAFGRMNLLDAEFHEHLVACAESESLQRTWTVAAPLDLIFAHDIAALLEHVAERAGLVSDAEKHVRLLAGLRSGDLAQAEAALKEHFTQPPRAGMIALDAASVAVLGW